MEYWGKSKPGRDSISLNALFQYSNIPTGVQTTGKSLSCRIINIHERSENQRMCTFDIIFLTDCYQG